MYQNKTTRLTRYTTDDASTILPHWNHYELRQYLPSPLPNTLAELEKQIDTWNQAFANRTAFNFAIRNLESDQLVGHASLNNISWISRNAELSQLAIFDPDARGKGFGQDALITLLDFAFNFLDLHNIYLWVEANNQGAIKLYQKIGFNHCGTMRQLAYRNGQHLDVNVMDILKPEFIEQHGILPK